MDLTYPEYQQYIAAQLAPENLQTAVAQLKPKILFTKDEQGEWQPLRHAGYTLTTPTFGEGGERENIKAYVKLADIQQQIMGILDPAAYVPAPVSAFHQTVARLVSGSVYENQIAGKLDKRFIKALDDVLTLLPQFESIQMNIRGVTVLPGGFVAALLTAADEWEYQRFISFRSMIYRNEALRQMGVEPQRPFIGHVTLAYLQDVLQPEAQISLSGRLCAMNQQHFATPVSFSLCRAVLYQFDNYLRFYRESAWPVYRFSRGSRS